ncbi:MAG: excinuclease ABC subunit C [Calditrichaeota bacterium]|nr:excinuclease ABC subunit C [Calditrichota bacterium]
MNEILQKKLDNLPALPGVYIFKNEKGKVIYIGKAKNLRNRVRSYFQNSRKGEPKLRVLVRKVRDVETISTDSEVEALILEANMIKEYKPRYNVTLKDDKSYPYIRVTHEEFPRIFPTRKIVKDGSRYFGPYTDVHSMRSLLKAVRKIFPVRSCNYRLDEQTVASRKIKLCLDYYIQRCPGPCQGLISQEDYRTIVNQMVRFIEGRNNEVVKELRQAMQKQADAQRFEEAARIRDQIQAIEQFQSRQKMVSQDEVDRDIVGIYQEEKIAAGIVFKVREGKIIGRYHFYLKNTMGESDQEILKSFLLQYYVKVDFLPKEIHLPFELPEIEDIREWFRKRRGKACLLLVPKRGEKRKLVEMAQRNAKLVLRELLLQKMKEKKERIPGDVLALQKDLNLAHPPRRIEAFDISHISGSDTVASMVTFVDGLPRKSDYRKFRIRSVTGVDDFASMKEVVTRRYRRILEEKGRMPDLILIDGGKGQLSSAVEALHELGIHDQPVAALAKRLDEVYLPGFSDPQNIPRTSPGIKLLQRVRDESHRFAITFHRTLRKKRTLQSQLDGIPGIGEKRRNLLIQKFGSVQKIQEARKEELEAVRGIPKNLAGKIWEYFHLERDVERT